MSEQDPTERPLAEPPSGQWSARQPIRFTSQSNSAAVTYGGAFAVGIILLGLLAEWALRKLGLR